MGKIARRRQWLSLLSRQDPLGKNDCLRLIRVLVERLYQFLQRDLSEPLSG
mgnify:CR=1 FL=1